MTNAAVQPREQSEGHELPTGREEDWRYAPLDVIRHRLDELAVRPSNRCGVRRDDIDRLAGSHGSLRIVVVDGVHVPAMSDGEVPVGLWCGTAQDVPPSQLSQPPESVVEPADGFEALNRCGSDAVHLRVADGVELVEPVHVVHVSTGALAHPRVVLHVGTGSCMRYIESYVSAVGGGLTNASTVLHQAPGSVVTVHRVQEERADAVHVGRLHLRLHRGAEADLTLLSRGATASRLATRLELVEPSASSRVTSLLAPLPGARHDDVVTVDHLASHCVSDLSVRSVVAERARVSSSGHVVVRPETVGSSAQQRTDSLLLHPSAQADSRPWLEIFADDVRASHGSATGRLDDDALFYLRSRGIPRAQARDVLVGAFARVVVEQIEPDSLRHRVARWFERAASA
jgi:Fe-S cluster assembly protein SufD